MRVYPNKKNVVLLPLYSKQMLVEMSKSDYKKLCKDCPKVKDLKAREQLDATERKAMWLVGIKVVQTPNGLYRLF